MEAPNFNLLLFFITMKIIHKRSKRRFAIRFLALLALLNIDQVLAQTESCQQLIQSKYGEVASDRGRLEPTTYVSWNGEGWLKCKYQTGSFVSNAICGGKKYGIDINYVIDAKGNQWNLVDIERKRSTKCEQAGPREFHQKEVTYQKKRVEGTNGISVEREYHDTSVYKF